ncbi:MAG: glycosyltransferase [Bacteroidia bacterium]|nr:glycosyltransferase [Bacteroidia bacterium]
MPIRRIKQRFDLAREQKASLESIKKDLAKIRAKFPYLVLTPKPTGMNYRGIFNATLGLFGEACLEIPQYYSNSLLSDKQNLDWIMLLAELEFEQVIASGTHPYFMDILHEYKHVSAKPTGAIFHGALTELADDHHKLASFNKFSNLVSEGVIDKIGFVKKGLAETFAGLKNVRCYPLYLKTKLPSETLPTKPSREYPIIAVPGVSNFNKNIHNQVAAALLVKNSKVFVWGNEQDFKIWNAGDRIVYQNHSGHADFLKVLSQCDATMYLSFSESWGQIITESLALGIPCLCSDTNPILDTNPALKEFLTISANDNPFLISQRLEQVLEKGEAWKTEMKNQVVFLNQLAEEKKEAFIQDLNSSNFHILPPSKTTATGKLNPFK